MRLAILVVLMSLAALAPGQDRRRAIMRAVSSGSGGGGGGSCPADGSPSDSQTGTGSSLKLGNVDNAYYFLGQAAYTPGAARTVCKLGFFLLAEGDISGRTYRAYVYTMSGPNLNTVVASSSAVAGNNGWGSMVMFALTSDAVLTSGTPYAFVLKLESGALSNTDYLHCFYEPVPSPDANGYQERFDVAGVAQAGPGAFDATFRVYWK